MLINFTAARLATKEIVFTQMTNQAKNTREMFRNLSFSKQIEIKGKL